MFYEVGGMMFNLDHIVMVNDHGRVVIDVTGVRTDFTGELNVSDDEWNGFMSAIQSHGRQDASPKKYAERMQALKELVEMSKPQNPEKPFGSPGGFVGGSGP